MSLLTGSSILLLLVVIFFSFFLSPDSRTARGLHGASIVPVGKLAEVDRTLQIKGSLMARASDNGITEFFSRSPTQVVQHQ